MDDSWAAVTLGRSFTFIDKKSKNLTGRVLCLMCDYKITKMYTLSTLQSFYSRPNPLDQISDVRLACLWAVSLLSGMTCRGKYWAHCPANGLAKTHYFKYRPILWSATGALTPATLIRTQFSDCSTVSPSLAASNSWSDSGVPWAPVMTSFLTIITLAHIWTVIGCLQSSLS